MARYNKKYTKEQIQEAVSKSICYSDIFRNLGIKINGGSFLWIKSIIKKFEISTDHFQKTNQKLIQAGLEATQRTREKKYENKDISNDKRRLNAHELRSFMNFWGQIEKCSNCSLSDWLDEPIRLDIDHLDNNPLNNKLENLQFLCPNCHRLKTIKKDNSSKRKTITQKIPCKCGKLKNQRAKMCSNCRLENPDRFKIIWPDNEVFQKMLLEIPATKLAKQLGVSDRAILSHARRNGLHKPSVGYWRKVRVVGLEPTTVQDGFGNL